ncbi:MAG: nuclear transport factor 2 family protein [Chitinophagales bacterium]
MKKILFASIASLFMMACNNEKKEDDTSKKTDDMKALYEKNLAVVKSAVAAFEKKDIDGWAAAVADSAKWSSPAYGDTVNTKAHWKESLTVYLNNWNDLKLTNPNYLPGVDSATQEPDGSVRFYGVWVGTHKSGQKTSDKFYGAYDFNKDNKIVFGDEYFDVGGLINAVTPKK